MYACLKLLDATVDGLNVGQVGGILIVDAHCNNGDLLEAFIIKKLGTKIPMRYFGIAADQGAAEFIKHQRIESIAIRVKSKLLMMSGLEIKDDFPTELVDSPPARPNLQVMVWDSETKSLQVPQTLFEKWGNHMSLSADFQAVLQKAQADLGYSMPLPSTTQIAGQKRAAGDGPVPHVPRLI